VSPLIPAEPLDEVIRKLVQVWGADRASLVFGPVVKRIVELAQAGGSAELELSMRIHKGRLMEARFDPDHKLT
jgi:hypothetical protein